MRRRWKALVAVGAFALVTGLVFLLPPRDDGLDWVREYGGTETVEPISLNFWNPAITPEKLEAGFRGYRHTFSYRMLPSKSIREINDRWPKSELLLMQEVRLQAGKPDILVIDRYVKRPWIERQWASLKRTLGFR